MALAAHGPRLPPPSTPQERGESEVAAMARLMADGALPQLLQTARAAVGELRARLDKEAGEKLRGLLAAAAGKPRHGGKYPPRGGGGGRRR